MLTEHQIDELCEQRKLPEAGRALVNWIRANAPVRSTSGGRRSVKVRYTGHKMPFALEAEAFNTEWAAFVTYDFDAETLELYPQPVQIKIKYRNRDNKSVAPRITPDLFRICRTGFILEECKTEEKLRELARKEPNRYQLDVEGKWRSPPAETAAAEFGFQFKLRSTSENNWSLIENSEFMEDYYDKNCPTASASAFEALSIYFKAKPWSTIHELVMGELNFDADALYIMLASGNFHFDFLEDRLADFDHAIVYRDASTAAAHRLFARSQTGLAVGPGSPLDIKVGARFEWDNLGWVIVNVGSTCVWARSVEPALEGRDAPLVELSVGDLETLAKAGRISVPSINVQQADAESDARKIFDRCSPEQLKIASNRYQILFGAPTDDNALKSRKKRTKQYWLAAWRQAELKFGYGFLGLIPNLEHTQGNHFRKLDPAVIAIIDEAVEKWGLPKQLGVSPIYGDVRSKCKERGFEPPVRKTLRTILRDTITHKNKVERVGARAAYSEEPEFAVLEYTTPRHGVRPFHIAHIDHTPVPIVLLDKTLQVVIKTLWLTLMIDAYTRKVLAVYLTFDPPSYRSNMMILRECVKRFGKLPRWVVVDGGPDFKSTYFEQMLSHYKVNKKERPGSKPRFGSLIERLLRTTIEEFVYLLWGNTQAYAHFRQVSLEVDPLRLATWTLATFQEKLETYFETTYHKNIHDTLGCSPDQQMVQGIKLAGQRQHTFIPYNQDFFINTCPSTEKGVAKVGQHGVKIMYINYRSPILSEPGVRGTTIPVRYEPFNRGIAYAYVKGRWHTMHSELYAIFSRYSERAIQLTSTHYHLLHRGKEHARALNAERLAIFLRTVENEEWMLAQQRRDAESAPYRDAMRPAVVASPPLQEEDAIEGHRSTATEYLPSRLEEF